MLKFRINFLSKHLSNCFLDTHVCMTHNSKYVTRNQSIQFIKKIHGKRHKLIDMENGKGGFYHQCCFIICYLK